jgi:AraC-like DNA-binding protein
VARPGDLYAIGPDEPHAGGPVDEEGWKQRTVYVDLAHLRSLVGGERISGTSTLVEPIIRDPELSSTLYGIHYCSQTQGSALYRLERYMAFAERLFTRHALDGPPPLVIGKEDRAVKLAREFLEQHLDEQVHLTDIADAAGLPIYRLFRAFSRDVGMTPHGFQRQARIRMAMSLIRRGLGLSEVAAATGFADQAHLTRGFRRVLGITPGAYRLAMHS